MAINDNIGKALDKDFENFNFLPRKLELEDIDVGIRDFIESLNISMEDENENIRAVPIIWLAQELWAEKKFNWKAMRNEQGEEVTRPFITMIRTSVKKGTSPLRRTVPNKFKFKYVKVPAFDGTLKGFHFYKIPQPTWIDVSYELRFVGKYMEDVNLFYEKIMRDAYSDGQAYLKINEYNIPSMIDEPSEDNSTDDIASERTFQIVFPINLHAKLVDPTKFEKINTITKVSVKISEQKK